MTPAVTEGSSLQYETIDVNIVPDQYVTWIIDLWDGNRDDPATAVTRYIGVWRADQLETETGEAIDPTFTNKRSYYSSGRNIKPEPLVWEEIETVKQADTDAVRMKSQSDSMLNPEAYRYGTEGTRAKLYQAFMDAVDVLATDKENQEAWAAVDAYRKYQAEQHEK